MHQMARLSPQGLKHTFAWMRGRRYMKAPMAHYTSLRVGGPADLLVFPADVDELRAVVACAAAYDVPLTVLGNGSNLLVRAGGIRGVVVSLREAVKYISVLPPCHVGTPQPDVPMRVVVGAGVPLTRLLHVAIRDGLDGLAYAVGIPGTVGGAVVMNAGTELAATWDVIEQVKLLMPTGGILTVTAQDVLVGYRSAILPDCSIVLEATLRAARSISTVVRETVRQLYRSRRESQPLSYPNAGSIFKNPPGEQAGRLIDHLGLKGLCCGDAQVSFTHANFIINRGHASAGDVLALIDRIKDHVWMHTGLLLQEEVRIVGEEEGTAAR